MRCLNTFVEIVKGVVCQHAVFSLDVTVQSRGLTRALSRGEQVLTFNAIVKELCALRLLLTVSYSGSFYPFIQIQFNSL